MKLRVRAELVYRFDPPTDAIYKIQVAHWPGQDILEESLTFDPPVEFNEDEDVDFGARTLRCHVSGEVTLTYEALVDNGVLKGLPPEVSQHDWGELPAEVLPYLRRRVQDIRSPAHPREGRDPDRAEPGALV